MQKLVNIAESLGVPIKWTSCCTDFEAVIGKALQYKSTYNIKLQFPPQSVLAQAHSSRCSVTQNVFCITQYVFCIEVCSASGRPRYHVDCLCSRRFGCPRVSQTNPVSQQ